MSDQNSSTDGQHIAHRVEFDLGKVLYPQQARQMVARRFDKVQPALLAALMNYGPNGQTRPAFPMAQFDYSPKGFALIGYGPLGCEVVADAAPLIQQELATTGTLVHARSTTYEMNVERSSYPLTYRVPVMVVEKKVRHKELMTDPARGKDHVERLFLRSLARNAESVGLVLPEGVQVEFAGADRAKYAHYIEGAKTRTGATMAMLGLVNARFNVNLRLQGYWCAGYHLGAGSGKFNANIQRGLAQ